MMAAMTMTANVMAADSVPTVQSEAQAAIAVTPVAEPGTEPSTETPVPPQTEPVQPEIPDTEQGAYDAAYAWCMHFEVPADTVNRSIQRGNLAREYFHKEFSLIANETERIGRLLEIIS